MPVVCLLEKFYNNELEEYQYYIYIIDHSNISQAVEKWLNGEVMGELIGVDDNTTQLGEFIVEII